MHRRLALAMGAAWSCLLAADVARVATSSKVVYASTTAIGQDAGFAAMRKSIERLAALRGSSAHLEHRLMPTTSDAALQAAVEATMDSGCEALIAPDGGTALAAANALRRPSRLVKPPVVFASFPDPVVLGVVPSMQSPGGRITGVSLSDIWHGKRLELLREAFGSVRKVGVLVDRFWVPVRSFEEDVLMPARTLGLSAVRFDADSAMELDEVMRSTQAARMDAWYVADSYIALLAEAKIIDHIRRLQRPAIHTTESEVANGGALMAYAADRDFVFDALADLTLRVLRGEDPGSIPIQRPRRFLLAVRPRPEPAALRIHPSVVRRADRVY